MQSFLGLVNINFHKIILLHWFFFLSRTDGFPFTWNIKNIYKYILIFNMSTLLLVLRETHHFNLIKIEDIATTLGHPPPVVLTGHI